MDLLFYNQDIVTHPDNHSLPGIQRFSSFFKIFQPSVVVCIDRTNTFRLPVKTKSLFPLPALRLFSKTFDEVCNERAIELLKRAEALGVTLYIFYSGGIDSTLVLVSLLKNATPTQRKNITVLMSEESITENPHFYRDHIYGKLRVDSANSFPYLLGSKHILVGGEFNDQLFGSDLVANLIMKFGEAVIHKPYNRNTFFSFFNDNIKDEATTHFYLDLFERLIQKAPVSIATNHDYLWWINFSLKWQSVFLRMLSYTASRNISRIDMAYIETQYNHFFGTEDFQLWSMNNLDKRIKGTWNSYKWVCKDIIYDYTKDADYRDNKIKRGSLFFLLLQQGSYNFIDDALHFRKEVPAAEYYLPDNDFI